MLLRGRRSKTGPGVRRTCVERVEFADGTVWDEAMLAAAG